MWRLLMLLLPLCGCFDFEQIDADGRCGNRVLEPALGEDCDGVGAVEGSRCGAPDEATACRYTCGEGARCPADWACGDDLICRASSGQLEAPELLRLPGSRFDIGDFDGDGRRDVISFGNTSLGIAFGGLDHFESLFETRAPPPDVPAALGDVDGDGRMDLALPVASGPLLFRGQATRRVSAVPIPIAEHALEDAVPFALRRPGEPLEDVLLISARPPWRFEVLGRAVDAGAIEGLLGAGPLVGTVGQSEHEGATRLALAAEGDTQVLVVVARCTMECGLELEASLPLPDGQRVGRVGTWFADMDGDGALDLVSHTAPNALAVAKGGPEGFDDFVARPDLQPGLSCQTCPPGETDTLRWIGDMDLDGVADFVTRQGVTYFKPGEPPSFEAVQVGARPWGGLVVGDLNGDGVPDVAGFRPGILEVALTTGRGAFTVLNVPLTGSPGALSIGDFDGDLAPDLALLEGDTLVVFFSGRQGVPRDRVEMGTVESNSRMVRARTGRPPAPDQIHDLVVVSPGPAQVIAFEGDSGRRMLAPVPNRGVTSVVALGDFAGDEGLELLLLEDRPTMQGPQPAFRLLDGAALGGGPATATIDGDDCGLGEGFFVAHVTDLDGDGRDELLLAQSWFPGPDRMNGEWRVWRVRVEEGAVGCEEIAVLGGQVAIMGLQTADLDADGHLDLVATKGPHLRSSPGRAEIEVIWGDADGLGDARSSMAFAEGWGLSLAAGDLDPTPGLEVAWVQGAEAGLLSWPDREPTSLRGLELPGLPEKLRVADIDHDGLADLLAGTGDEIFVHRQRACDARRAAEGGCDRREE